VSQPIGAILAAEQEREAATYVVGWCSPKGSGTHRATLSLDGAPVAMETLSFNASGFGPGCGLLALADPCGADPDLPRVCGAVDGIACGLCAPEAGLCPVCGEDGQCR